MDAMLPIVPPIHEPILPSGDPIDPYPIGVDVMHWLDIEFIAAAAAPIAPMPDEPNTPEPKPLPCGESDAIAPADMPIVFIL